MKRVLSLLAVLLFVLLVSSCESFLQELQGKPAQAPANTASGIPATMDKDVAASLTGLVGKASQFISANGQKTTLAQIGDPQGIFTYNNLFVFVIDAKNGKVIAGADKSLAKADSKTKDEDGKFFIKEITKTANAKKDGYITYKWNKQDKSSYFQKKGNLILVGSN